MWSSLEHRPASHALATLTALAVSLGGCAAVLGIETFEERTVPTGGAGGGAQGGAGNVGGTASGGGGAGAGTTGGGGTAPANLVHDWSVRFRDPYSAETDQSTSRILSVEDGVIIAGGFEGSLDIDTDGAALTSAGGIDGFVARLMGEGAPVWAETMTGLDEQSCRGLAPFQDGIVVAGQYDGDITIGSDTDLSAQGMDPFVGAYFLDGEFRWSENYSFTGSQRAMGVAVDASTGTSEQIVLVGRYLNAFSVGESPLPTPTGHDAWVAKLDSNHTDLWVRGFGCATTNCADAVSQVAVDSQGNIIAAGTIGGNASIYGHNVVSQGNGALVVKLSPSGDVLWAKASSGMASEEATAVGVDHQNNVILAGYFESVTSFDDSDMDPIGATTGFVAKLRPDGAVAWSRPLGGADRGVADALAVADDGSVYVAGRFSGTMTAAGVQLECSAATNVFLVRLSPFGDLNFARCFGTEGMHMITALAVDPDGGVVLTGTLNGTIDFGGPSLTDGAYVDGDAARDIFVARLAPEP